MATMPEFQKTILIGLGGAGQQTVLRTKRLLFDAYGAIPPCVKILCLDTDATPLSLPSASGSQNYTFSRQEFFHLEVPQPTEFIKNSPEVQRWFVEPIPVGAISHGAGAVRQNGRLAFFYHFNEIQSRFRKIFDELMTQPLENLMNNAQMELGANTDFKLAKRDPEIFVCGSLAGGTGSGTFIDTGLLLRDLHKKLLIHGFFQLAWPYRNKPFAHRTGPNTYAALAELDNMQSIMYGSKNFHPYTIRYSNNKEITVNQAPYDLVHLIDGRTEYGQNLGELTAICDAMADAIFLSMSRMSFPVQSAVDNLRAAINTDDPKVWQGRYARYSSFGVSSIHYPAQELHRLISSLNALQLCRTAIDRLESPNTSSSQLSAQPAEVDQFITRLNLHRDYIQSKVCPDKGEVLLSIESYEIADSDFPSEIKARFEGEKKSIATQLEQRFKAQGQGFIEETLAAISEEIKKISTNPAYDSAYRREWCSRLLDHLKPLSKQAEDEFEQVTALVANLEKDVAARLNIAKDASYFPMIGGPRKKATLKWAEQAERLLLEIKRSINLVHEKQLYGKLIAKLEQEAAINVPSNSTALKVLRNAEATLSDLMIREKNNLEQLKSRPNHILLGNGNIAITDTYSSCLHWEDAFVSYEDFVKDKSIYHSEFFIDLHDEAPQKLSDLFYQYCLEKQAKFRSFDVDQALDCFKQLSDEPEHYLQKQFDRLIELSGALWSFDRGRITANQDLNVGKIINFGFCNQQVGANKYDAVINEAKSRYHIRYEPSYSTMGDPSRIWLLNFAAAIPAYFMNGLIDARNTYLEQISPTYHIDSDLEMNVPDLFPVAEIENMALRLLGMAIVPGIDVIQDEKLAKGHKFTCDHKAINDKYYFGEAKSWRLFREMYEDLKNNYDPKSDQNLLDELIVLLKAKVKTMDKTNLRKSIQDYLTKVHAKLGSKDFSRLSSARWTYQEVYELEKFLKPIAEGGYGMDVDCYLCG